MSFFPGEVLYFSLTLFATHVRHTVQLFIALLTDRSSISNASNSVPLRLDTSDNIQAAFEAIHELNIIKIRNNWIPSPEIEYSYPLTHNRIFASRSKREEQIWRNDILNEAATEHSTSKNDRPLSQQKVLIAYSRQQIELDDQKANT